LPVDNVWINDQDVVDVAAQRLVLQLMATDALLGQLLDELEETGLLDTAMLVVTADHGAVFSAGKNYRALQGVDDETKSQVLPVPLFVKYPDQRDGDVDDRSARTIDIVPTIADVLEVSLPDDWKFDGVSLREPPVKAREYVVVTEDTESDPQTISGPVDARSVRGYWRSLLGPSGQPNDGYRLGPHSRLVGTPVADVERGSPVGSVELDEPGAFGDVNPASGRVPARVSGVVRGATVDDWVAVVVNGQIAGVGPVYQADDGAFRLVAMIDPSFLRAGSNDVEINRIDSDGAELRLLER
jgi:hypothetical protein